MKSKLSSPCCLETPGQNQRLAIVGLEECAVLEELSVSSNNLVSLSSLAPLQHLKSLDVSQNPLTSLSHLACLPNLTFLAVITPH